MNSNLPPNPFEDSRRIGTVTQVVSGRVAINLPRAATASSRSHHGDHIQYGVVGEFICIPCGRGAILGRITETVLQDRDRMTVEPAGAAQAHSTPVGKASLYAFIDLHDIGKPTPITKMPRLSEFVYSAPPSFLQWVLNGCSTAAADEESVKLYLATASDCSDEPIGISPKSLFERHCAILGSTGGGKSYTIARILEEASSYFSKIVLIDPTGEYKIDIPGARHAIVGLRRDPASELVDFGLPLDHMMDADIFEFLSPSDGSQSISLKNAIKSLRLAYATTDEECGGFREPLFAGSNSSIIVKIKKDSAAYKGILRACEDKIIAKGGEFEASLLLRQLEEEFVRSTSAKPLWEEDNSLRSYCVGLTNKLEYMLSSNEYDLVFACDKATSLKVSIDDFVAKPEQMLLRISLENVRFGTPCHAAITNAIGRFLLQHARKDAFVKRPLLLIVDEAHNFVGTSAESSRDKVRSSCIEVIAKEGRKHKLTLCLATQRPSSLPAEILSQMGTMIVHRLANSEDRKAVEIAALTSEHSVGEFLPSLMQGEAVIIGPSFPIPIPVKVRTPTQRPVFSSPDHDADWAVPPDAKPMGNGLAI